MSSENNNLETRERIIHYLQKNHRTTTVELSQQWGFTRANIRYHIKQLLKEGIIEPLPVTAANHPGRGRPKLVYRLSSQSASQNYPRLAKALLKALAPDGLSKLSPAQLRTIAAEMFDLPGSLTSLPQRINQLTGELTGQGYQARWEASASGPLIRFHNCPYARLLAVDPGLCQLDQVILEQSIGFPVRQLAKINLLTGSPKTCTFQVQMSQGTLKI